MNFIKTNNLSKVNRHWFECDRKSMPFIHARRKGRYYSVSLDMGPTRFDLNRLGIELVEKEIKNEIDAVESQRNRHGINYCTHNVISNCDQVLPERVDSFCNKLFEISTYPRNIVEDKILKKSHDNLIDAFGN